MGEATKWPPSNICTGFTDSSSSIGELLELSETGCASLELPLIEDSGWARMYATELDPFDSAPGTPELILSALFLDSV